MSLELLRSVRSVEFSCPAADCAEIHRWPRSTAIARAAIPPLPLVVCESCSLMIEIYIDGERAFFVDCVRENVTLKLVAFREYAVWVPHAVRLTLTESIRCHSAGAWNGAVVLARKAVELIAVNLGGRGKALVARLDDLKRRDLITDQQWAAETYVRHVGNEAAHGAFDESDASRQAQATVAIVFAYEAGKHIYLRRKAETFRLQEHTAEFLHWLADHSLADSFGFSFPADDRSG